MPEVHDHVRTGRHIGLLARRTVLRGLASIGLIAPAAWFPGRAVAKRHKRRRRKKVTRNAFGCVSVTGTCRKSGQCCSGICVGRRGKKRCGAHNVSTCEGTDGCSGEARPCTSDAGVFGTCNVTTGQASYCVITAVCADCSTDADCEPRCGAGAACIVCSECLPSGRQTACASATAEGCLPA